MSDLTPSNPPQFGTAEYESAGADHCKFCNQPVGMQYYRVGQAIACGSCAMRLKAEMPVETAGLYARGLLFGFGAAIVGMALYATVTIVTGWEIGLVSLAVGWLVGKAIVKGARGFGGRKYQITAVLLTYFAVAVSAVPIGLSQMRKGQSATQTPAATVKTGEAGKADATKSEDAAKTPAEAEKADPDADEADSADESKAAPDAKSGSEPEEQMGLGMALVTLLFVGLASPFLALASPGQGLIGLVILFIGIQVAWRLTAATALVVDGPIDNSSASNSTSSSATSES